MDAPRERDEREGRATDRKASHRAGDLGDDDHSSSLLPCWPELALPENLKVQSQQTT